MIINDEKILLALAQLLCARDNGIAKTILENLPRTSLLDILKTPYSMHELKFKKSYLDLAAKIIAIIELAEDKTGMLH